MFAHAQSILTSVLPGPFSARKCLHEENLVDIKRKVLKHSEVLNVELQRKENNSMGIVKTKIFIVPVLVNSNTCFELDKHRFCHQKML